MVTSLIVHRVWTWHLPWCARLVWLLKALEKAKGTLIKNRECFLTSKWLQLPQICTACLHSYKLWRLTIHYVKQSKLLFPFFVFPQHSFYIFSQWNYLSESGQTWLSLWRAFQKCFSTYPNWMRAWFLSYVLHLPTQVYIPPIEHKGQLSQALQLICVTFPGRRNHSMLVNHYRTQLIILGAYMRISRCPSPPFFFFSSSFLPCFLMPLVLLHILVDTRWLHGDKACFSCANQPARKHRCCKHPEAPSATAASSRW